MDKIKLKRLISKYNYLDIYLQEIKLQYTIYNDTFLKEYYEINPEEISNEKDKINIKKENNNDSTDTDNDQKEKNKSDDTNSSENSETLDTDLKDDSIDPIIKETINKLYKKISLKIHPDKPNGNSEQFIKALNAYNSNNILELIILAELYNIEYVLNDHVFSYIENEIKKIDDKINELQHHVCWLWCNADNDTKKKFKLPK